MVSPQGRREQARLAIKKGCSKRRACALVQVSRSALDYKAQMPGKDAKLIGQLREIARQLPRYGYRRATAVLRHEGEAINPKRVYRVWRNQGLGLPEATTETSCP